jgi:hypothetical protein
MIIQYNPMPMMMTPDMTPRIPNLEENLVGRILQIPEVRMAIWKKMFLKEQAKNPGRRMVCFLDSLTFFVPHLRL